jgi:hypothetical protein
MRAKFRPEVANLSVPEEEEGRKGGDVVSFRHGITSVHINLQYGMCRMWNDFRNSRLHNFKKMTTVLSTKLGGRTIFPHCDAEYSAFHRNVDNKDFFTV